MSAARGALALLACLAVAACALPGARTPVLGLVSEGVYTQRHGNFSCPLRIPSLNLVNEPLIIDARRVTRTEYIPLAQREPGDWRNTRTISDAIHPSMRVTFEYPSGAEIEIASGKRIHSTQSVLESGMSGGFSWRFVRREVDRSPGRMMMGLLLVPWHEPGNRYMGIDPAEAYRQGQGPDPELWIRSNIVIDTTVHDVTVKLPAAALLSTEIESRDLKAIRDAIVLRPEFQDALLNDVLGWLEGCRFSGTLR